MICNPYVNINNFIFKAGREVREGLFTALLLLAKILYIEKSIFFTLNRTDEAGIGALLVVLPRSTKVVLSINGFWKESVGCRHYQGRDVEFLSPDIPGM